MTVLYNATLFRTRNNILTAINRFDSELDQNIVRKFIPIFYNFLTGDSLKHKFNLKSLSDIRPGVLQNNFDPIYYNRGESSHRIKLMVDGKLWTMRYNYKINDYLNLNDASVFDEIRSSITEIDQKKTDTAKAPNTVHNLDSDIVS
jgi:hypothetical protein